MRQGHVSIIVGGSRGIGQAIARALAARGGNVLVIGRDRQRIGETVGGLATLGTGQHFGRALDTSDPGDMSEMAAFCEEKFGRADLLVFSAAVSGYEDISKIPPQMLDLPFAAWRKALDVNLHGAFLANRAVLPLMVRQGEGDILNIGSALTPRGMRGRAHAAAYSATKFALTAFTHCLASEMSEHGIRVNVAFPGPIGTPLIEGTALASDFGGQITVEHFAQAMVRLLEFSTDCMPADPLVLPMRGGGLAARSRGATRGARA
jgi:NAD(P)-dependent dehydrogenase (short-subunit alcohol dehydrogenase family)